MIAPLPCVLLAVLPLAPPASDGDHAALHPAGSTLYVELPDVGALPEAYATTPLARLLQDEELHAALAAMAGEEALDPAALWQQALADLPLEPEVRDELLRILGGIERVSWSVGGLGSGGAEAWQAAERARAADGALRRLQDAILATQGAFDGNLGSLGLEDDSLTLDPWGRPYEVLPTAEGGWLVRTLGADGREGGFLADADRSSEQAADPDLLALAGIRTRLVVDFSEAGLAPVVALMPLSWLGGDLEVRATEEGNELTSPEVPGYSLRILADDTRVVVDFAPVDAPAGPTIELADEGTLATDPDYRAAADRVPAGPGTVVWRGFRDLTRELFTDVGRRLGQGAPQGANAALLSLLEGTGAWRTSIQDGEFVKDAAELAAGEPRPVDVAYLDAVPAEAIGAWATTFDADAVIDFVLQLAGAEDDPEALLASVREATGLHLRDDLAAHLGETAFLYCEPLLALGPPKLRAYVELDDPAAFTASLDKLAAWAGESLGPGVSVKSKPYRGAPVHTFSFAELEGMGPMQPHPTLAIVGDDLIVSLNAVHAKREIKRLAALEDEQGEPHALLARLDPDAVYTGIGYMDWGAMIEGVYRMGKLAAGFFGGMAEVPVDLTALPEPEVLGRHFPPSFSTTRVDDGVSVSHKTSAFGPEIPLGLGGGGALLTTIRVAEAGMVEIEAGVAVPPEDAVYEAPDDGVVSTRETLGRIRTGLAVFKIENGALPATLDELVAPTASYPRGFLDEPELPTDAWGRPFVYRVEGDAYFLHSTGPDGVDQGGAGDDVSTS